MGKGNNLQDGREIGWFQREGDRIRLHLKQKVEFFTAVRVRIKNLIICFIDNY